LDLDSAAPALRSYHAQGVTQSRRVKAISRFFTPAAFNSSNENDFNVPPISASVMHNDMMAAGRRPKLERHAQTLLLAFFLFYFHIFS